MFGLSEIGNLTVENPVNGEIEMAIDDPGVHVTYLQQYTTFTKPFTSEDLFKEHPFLITNLLSLNYVERNPKFLQVYRAVDKQ